MDAILPTAVGVVTEMGGVSLEAFRDDILVVFREVRAAHAHMSPEAVRRLPAIHDLRALLFWYYEAGETTAGLEPFAQAWMVQLLAGHTKDELDALTRRALARGSSEGCESLGTVRPAAIQRW